MAGGRFLTGLDWSRPELVERRALDRPLLEPGGSHRGRTSRNLAVLSPPSHALGAQNPADRYEFTRDLARDLRALSDEPSRRRSATIREKGTRKTLDSVAVLPLVDLKAELGQEYFADGMTEALITDLAKIGALKVISRTSAMRYKGTDKSLPQIARELGVEAVVEGSVLRAGDRIRITAQLIHAASDQHLWAESYERDLGDILSLQGEVARAIAREIRVKLTQQEDALLGRARRVDPKAHEAYLRGLQNFNKWRLPEAVEYFEQAIARG